MSKYIINGETLEKIANAIREKTGGTEQMTPAAMVEAIDGLGTGGATGPRIEYTLDALGQIIGVALHEMISVPAYAFYTNTTLEMVDCSGSPNLTSIGDYAFQGCTKLTQITLPKNLASIGKSAFQSCTSLSLTALPKSLTSIGDAAFQSCTNLSLTALPESLTSIGATAFLGCTSLSLTALPKSLTSIGHRAFRKCTKLVNMEIAAKVFGAGHNIFGDCTGLRNVWIRSTCDTISGISGAASAPFAGCSTSLAIYAEDTAQQSGWQTYFDRTGNQGGTTVTVTYGQTTRPW